MTRPSTKHGQGLRAAQKGVLLRIIGSFGRLLFVHESPARQRASIRPRSLPSAPSQRAFSCKHRKWFHVVVFWSLEARTPNRGSEDLAYPYTLFASKFAPAATSAETHLSLPFQAAECSGVCHSSSMAFTFAPFASRKRTISVWPRYAAACSGDSLPAMGCQAKEAQQRCKR